MESRKLGNKTKIIKLLSKIGNYGLIILTFKKCLEKKYITKLGGSGTNLE